MAGQPRSIDVLVREAMKPVVEHACREVGRTIAELAAAELALRLERQGRSPPARVRGPKGRPMTRWVADRRARRVPNFVIDLTGLRTKRQIVDRYGADVAFEAGKPAPKPKG